MFKQIKILRIGSGIGWLLLGFGAALPVLADDFETLPRNLSNLPGAKTQYAAGAIMPDADPFNLLLNSREIRHDLGITKAQLHKLNSISQYFRTQVEESSFRSTDEVQQNTQAGQQMINRILEPAQLERFRQVLLQLAGPCEILRDQRALKHLKIIPDAEQYRQMTRVCRTQDEQIRRAAELSNRVNANDQCKARAAAYHQTQGIKSAAEQQITQLLNPAQLKTLHEMHGDPLELPPISCDSTTRS